MYHPPPLPMAPPTARLDSGRGGPDVVVDSATEQVVDIDPALLGGAPAAPRPRRELRGDGEPAARLAAAGDPRSDLALVALALALACVAIVALSALSKSRAS